MRPRPDRARAAWPSPLFSAAFFLSGAAALVYELLWFRLLGHVFGSTATATSTLLAAYLFGLGVGAWIFGKISDRFTRLPILYVAIEVAIGLFGLASHALLSRGAALYALAHGWAGESSGRLLLARLVVSFILVAIPTTLMGGTFPLMVHLLKSSRVDVGRATGRAYAINTAGAALGALSLPALLLPRLGVAASLAVAAAFNLGAAVCAYLQSRRLEPTPAAAQAQVEARVDAVADAAGVLREAGEGATAPPPKGTREAQIGAPSIAPLLAAFFCSSLASLALETVWTRHLSMFFGAQTFTFAWVLFGYLVGLFLGGGAYARLRALGIEPARLLRGALLLTALGVALPLPFLDRLAVPQINLMLSLGVSNGTFLLTSGLVIIGLLLAPAFGFGLVFPAVVDLLAREGRRVGASVGLTYAVNTAGTTLGALAAGFLLVPTLGSQRTLEVCVLLVAGALAIAGGIPARGAPPLRPAIRYGVPAAFLIMLIMPRWDWAFAHAQYSKDPLSFLQRYADGSLWNTIRNYRFPYFKEGTEATVSVCEMPDGARVLYVNGKPDASNIPDDMVAQRLLACIPGLFHPNPKRALVIGVGSGTTVATLKRFPVQTIDAAEISPEVGQAARMFFADINDHFLEDSRVWLRLDDGRNFLHFQPPDTYDVIISEPSNPWMAGVSALFTDEFFAEAKSKLRPGGILCQWFHYYNMSLDHIRLLARTFRRQFPEAALFVIRGARPTGDILLIGSKGPLRLARLPEDPSVPEGIRTGLAEVGNGGTQQIMSGLIASPADFEAFGRRGPMNTDDLPILEFEAPADRFLGGFYETLSALLTSTESTFLPAGPDPKESPASVEVAKDGLGLPRGLPPGEETLRGVTVLSRFRKGGDDLSRWALVGREFESAGTSTGLYRLARELARPDELVDIGASLVGPGLVSRNEINVNGHVGLSVLAESDGRRSVVVAWNCPVRSRAFLLSRRVPLAGSPDPSQIAAELAASYPCSHAAH